MKLILEKVGTINKIVKEDIQHNYMVIQWNEKKHGYVQLEKSKVTKESLTTLLESIEYPLENEIIEAIFIYENGLLIHQFEHPIRVLHFVPFQPGKIVWVENSFEQKKILIDGHPEYKNIGAGLVLICNEEGMLMDLPKDRGFHGSFFIARVVEDSIESLLSPHIKMVSEEFENRPNIVCKNDFLREYFENYSAPNNSYSHTINDVHTVIDEAKVIEWLLNQNEIELKQVERAIKDCINARIPVADYLRKMSYLLAKNMNRNPF